MELYVKMFSEEFSNMEVVCSVKKTKQWQLNVGGGQRKPSALVVEILNVVF
jgi:hypothetical protein